MNSKINIGDKVYMCIENRVEEFEVEWVRYVDKQYAYKTKRSKIDGAVRGFFDYDIGRSVYLTREEAETERAERERLIELIKEGKAIANWHRYEMSKTIADHLLANGVKIPPVRIGQELWDIHYNRPRKWEVCYIGYNGNEWFINIHYYKNKYNFATKQIIDKFFGKMIYFSKEEAEQAINAKRAVSMVDGHIEE